MSAREPELSSREIKIVRGMIDEYQYRELHSRHIRETWSTGKTFLVTLGIVLTCLSQIVTMVAVLR